MLIAVTGASGFIGSALTESLKDKGHDVLSVGRSSGDIIWNPAIGEIDAEKLEGVEAVVHLAGENIASRRWTEKQKKRILDSRVEGTKLLSRTLANLSKPPSVLLSGSAIGIYGSRDDEELTEDSTKGSGFLSDVVDKWEKSTSEASEAGILVTHLRTGLVQSPKDGMMKKILPLFKLGLGGKLGSGSQYWSWISLEDEVRLITWLLTAGLAGPVNLTAPIPVTNLEFTKSLGRSVNRPTFFPVPMLGPKLLLGRELASELIENSARVIPQRAIENGFEFKHVDLDTSLPEILSIKNG